MIIANIRINLSSAEALSCASIPKNAVGLKVRFQYADPLWNKFSKTAVFRNGTRTVNSILVDDCAVIPHELLSKIKDTIYVGLYGTDSNRALAIPTIWAKLGEVSSAANPSASVASEAALPYWAQIQEKVDSLEQEMMVQEDLDHALQHAKESGTFDGPQGPKGEQGETGPAGYTPVAGVDYWTTEDKHTISAEAANIAANSIHHSSDIICTATGSRICLDDTSNRELHGLTLFGKTTQNGTPTPDAPVPLETVGADGNVDVRIANSNLMPFPYQDIDGATTNGLTFNVKPDGSVVVNGTATAEAFFSFSSTSGKQLYLPKGKYTFSGVPDGTYGGSLRPQLWVRNASGTVRFAVYAEGKIVEITEPDYFAVSIDIVKGNALNNYVIKPMINVGETALPFESPIERQTLTAQTPNGLNGIPVSSGGNYTDENGQQWVCDEIDFARGKYIQRIKSITLDGDESIGVESVTVSGISCKRIWYKANDADLSLEHRTQVLSDHFTPSGRNITYGVAVVGTSGYLNLYLSESMQNFDKEQAKVWLAENPVTVQYILVTPIETDLSAEEIAQYSALHTNYPNTTIFNDEGAGMDVKYVADTKLYIDSKFAELASAILNT